ncbi:MAG TPA: acyl-CoA dehydrogenase family protein [Steroidobacteraceae bacterium]|nr:acyl-CoA dehydrogenase family protein [Steroidobacteraceae bacterium]
MNLDFSDDQKALGEHARRLLTERSTSAVIRRVMADNAPYDPELWAALAELGYLGAAIPESYGGAGLGHLELCVIASELGRALAPVPVASSIYLAAEFLLEAGSEAQKREYLPRLAAGEAIGTFAFAETAGAASAATVRSAVSGGRLTGRKLAVLDGAAATLAVVVARGEAGSGDPSLYLVDLNGPGVRRETVATIDPTRGHANLAFEGAPAEPLGAAGAGVAVIDRVLDRAAVLMAFEQVGGAERALEIARDYSLQRSAFGRLIGSFQALKHMMADMYVSATLARANAYYGAWALSTASPELPVAAATARVSATKAFQHCARNCIQVHGGMGFTWEFDCHLFYRRANLLALALGGLSEWEDRLIERMKNAKGVAA